MGIRSHDWRRLARLIAGWLFVLLGLAGLVLPILQGFLFLFVGIALLSMASPRVRLARIRLGARYPKFRVGHQKAHDWIHRQQARFGLGGRKPAAGCRPPSSGS